ncbi:MAG: FAD-dependent oxidoreductase, partial [Clostridia bacterium]|nr:FAD-dependent oxidoreductase [Clostridia bacterium]
GSWDFVVVGGGVAGMCAAIAAARNGLKVALIQDRKVIGGNNSSEIRVGLGGQIGVGKYPSLGYILNEFGPVGRGNARTGETYEDGRKMDAILAEKNITLFTGYRVTGVEKSDERTIAAVIATQTDNYTEIRVGGALFADCTGDGALGVLAGAEWRMGREPKSMYGEPSAPEKADEITLGASVLWYSLESDSPTTFPDIDWGLPIGPETVEKVHRGQWYWEVGFADDQMADAERIRDYGMYVCYSNWAYIKNRSSFRDEFSHAYLAWVAYLAGKRESRRIIGDFVLTENDLVNFVVYPDGCASTSWYIDDHLPDPLNARTFKDPYLAKEGSILTPLGFYPIPYRCFYSKDLCNMFMAGRDISVSHLALGTTRVMRTTAMIGEVVGLAAAVCRENGILPRDIYLSAFDKLEEKMEKGAGDKSRPFTQNYTLVDKTAEHNEDL